MRWTHPVHMKTATVRDLRNNFGRLEALLNEGEQIRIEKRGEPVALLTSLAHKRRKKPTLPDFAARRRAIWGDRVFSEAEVKAMREDEHQAEGV